MKNVIKFYLLFCIFFLHSVIVYSESAVDIVTKVDALMYPSCKSTITLEFVKKDGNKDVYGITSYAKDINQKVIVRFTSPPSRVGNDLIMLDRNVWAYDKNAGRILKIASSKSFGGTDFSYGDVVRLNMSDNYTPEIKSEDDTIWTLLLTAKERSAPYYQIEFIVKKESYIPVKAICFSRNSNIVKTIEYLDNKNINGQVKPSRILIKSPFTPDEYSEMIIKQEELKEYPDLIFNKRNLAMRQEDRY